MLLMLLAAVAARAQSVRWEAGDSALGTVVQLVFEDCEPTGEPRLPVIPGATLTLTGRSTSVNMVNTSVTRSLILSYIVAARGSAALQIPEFVVDTNKGKLRVAAFNAAAPALSAWASAAARASNAIAMVSVFMMTVTIRRNCRRGHGSSVPICGVRAGNAGTAVPVSARALLPRAGVASAGAPVGRSRSAAAVEAASASASSTIAPRAARRLRRAG
jgi:hypothetical protein